MRLIKALFTGLLALFPAGVVFLSGCALHAPLQPLSPDDSRSVFQEIARMRHRQQGCPQGISADFSSRSNYLGYAVGVDGYLLARRPAFLKIVALHPGGQPISILGVKGNRFRFVSILDGKVYEGDTGTELFRKTQVPRLDTRFVFFFLAGQLPWDAVVGNDLYATDDAAVVKARGILATGQEVVFFYHRKAKRILSMAFEDDEHGWEITYKGFDTNNPCLPPASISIQDSEGRRLDLRLSGRTLQRDMAAGLFRVPVPPGFQSGR